jgi:hypothetical protein
MLSARSGLLGSHRFKDFFFHLRKINFLKGCVNLLLPRHIPEGQYAKSNNEPG